MTNRAQRDAETVARAQWFDAQIAALLAASNDPDRARHIVGERKALLVGLNLKARLQSVKDMLLSFRLIDAETLEKQFSAREPEKRGRDGV